jgi:hypothetical protein
MDFWMLNKHTLFLKSSYHFLKKRCFEFKFCILILITSFYNAQITYGIFLLGMDKYHLVIIMCQHCACYKSCKMDFGPSFFLLDFGPPNHSKTPLFKGLGINLKFLTNRNDQFHWTLLLGPLSKVALSFKESESNWK